MTRSRCVAAVLLLGLVLAGWTFYFEPRSLRVSSYALSPPDWPERLHGLTIALLSDLHVGSPYYGVDKLEEVVRLVNEARPDLVLLAGDYVIQGVRGGRFVSPETLAPVLGRLRAPEGVFAVLGNHDHWLDAERVRLALEGAGISVLDDESVRLDRFWVVGIGDLWEGQPDVSRALDTVDDDAPVIAFTHNPDVFPDIPARVTLTLAGHTHGGQVRLPLLGTPIVPSLYGERFVKGHVVEDGRHLFVTSGLGSSIVPARFRVPPEVALLRLTSAVR